MTYTAQMKYHPIAGKRFNRWPSIYFLGGISLVAVVFCPWYLYQHGITQAGFWIFAFMCTTTVLAVTAGYHRLFSHKAYQANTVYQFLMLGFGAASLQQSALKWASLHRTHHAYTDTLRDPYNIKKGFWYAHVGWILFWIRSLDMKNVQDLAKNKLVMHQNNYFQLWAAMFGIVLPVGLGFLFGQPFEALLFGVGVRLFVVFQVVFFINSFAHTFGDKTFDKNVSARDNWVGAFLTGGEGYHSFHHKFSTDYRNGHLWYHWDPSKWLIYVSSLFGWAWDLKRTPKEKILEAKIAAASA